MPALINGILKKLSWVITDFPFVFHHPAHQPFGLVSRFQCILGAIVVKFRGSFWVGILAQQRKDQRLHLMKCGQLVMASSKQFPRFARQWLLATPNGTVNSANLLAYSVSDHPNSANIPL